MRVLIVDGGAGRSAVAPALAALGHSVAGETQVGPEVRGWIERQHPDLVAFELGAQDGAEGARRALADMIDGLQVPVIAIASGTDPAAAAMLARAGVGAVVWKPIDPRALAAALAVAVARHGEMIDLQRQGDEVQRERVRLLQILDASFDGIYIVRADGAMSMCNQAAERLLGMREGQLDGHRLDDWLAMMHARDGAGHRLELEALPQSRALRGRAVPEQRLWIDALDGVERCLAVSASAVRDDGGRIEEVVCLLRDITGDQEREREVERRSDRRRRELTRLSSELLAASSASDLAQRCVARVREALAADRVRLITIGDDGKRRQMKAEVGTTPESVGHTLPPNRRMGIAGYALIRGETFWSRDLLAEDRFELDEGDASDRSVVAAPLMVGERALGIMVCTAHKPDAFDADDAHLVTLMANQAAMASENMRLTDRLTDQQKLSALGVMAAGIVHEIKNPLSYIQSNVESALELLERLDHEAGRGIPVRLDERRIAEDRQALSEARNGCTRVFKIIEDIREYAHPGRARPEPSDVNRLVEVALTLASSELRRWCRVARDLESVPAVLCDGPKISQVVVNLLVNAAQAIQRTGRVGNVRVASRRDGDAVRILVADDGPGIESALLDKIFEPFVTTKPAGQGTGLGLAICRRLMESQGGTITVDSLFGHGATFTVTLPLGQALAEGVAP